MFANSKNFFYFCAPKRGEMLEWLKRHAWKACIRQKCIRGSNPRLSADMKKRREVNTIIIIN